MSNLESLEKKINSEFGTKIKNSKIKHNQIYIAIDSEDILDTTILLKTNLIKKFPEFKNIFIAEPGFLNIEFNEDFWQNFLSELLNLKEKFGSNYSKKNKYNI